MRLYKIFLIALIAESMASWGHCLPIKGPVKTLEAPSYKIRGTDYLPVMLVCDAYGIDWEWDPVSMTVDLNKENRTVRLRVGEYRVYANGAINVQERPVILHKGAVCVPLDFLRTVFDKVFFAPLKRVVPEPIKEGPIIQKEAEPYYRIRKLVLDAGHGGYDPGAIGRDGIKEKYIVLDITKKVKALLEDEGMEIALTRYDDSFIPLWRRTEIANRSGADLFVSIHANASRTRRLQGFEVYYLSEVIDDEARALSIAKNDLDAILWDLRLTEDRREAIELGNCILDNIDVKKRDIKSARFFVLKGARMPAVLVETGYISNREECSLLGDREYRSDIAKKIARGIISFKKRFEDTEGFTR